MKNKERTIFVISLMKILVTDMQVSFNNIIEVNNILKDHNLDFKVHLKDTCGGSSMWIEALNSDVSPSSNSLLYTLIEDYFKKLRVTLEYSDDRISFWVARK